MINFEHNLRRHYYHQGWKLIFRLITMAKYHLKFAITIKLLQKLRKRQYGTITLI